MSGFNERFHSASCQRLDQTSSPGRQLASGVDGLDQRRFGAHPLSRALVEGTPEEASLLPNGVTRHPHRSLNGRQPAYQSYRCTSGRFFRSG